MSSSTTPTNLGLVGLGNFMRRVHLPNLARMPECRLRGLCDVNPAVLEEQGARWKPDYLTTDFQEILRDRSIEIVFIAVRDKLQTDFAIAALEAGKHVYVEKPLARSADDAERVVTAQAKSDRRLAVGFNRRYSPIYRLARDIALAEGGVYNLHFHMTDDAWRWASTYPPGHLLRLDAGHLFDLLRWFTGAEAETVCCQASRPDDDAILVRMTNGCVATIMLSGHGTMDMPKEGMNAILRRGGIVADDFAELRTYGLQGREHRIAFRGHTDGQQECLHKYLMQSTGAQGWSAIRRLIWEMRQRVGNGATAGVDEPEIDRFVQSMLPNFMRDQGWFESARVFIDAVRCQRPSDHATAADGLAAAHIADAAEHSRDNGGAAVKVLHAGATVQRR
jgi:predicted dehydrogenase